MRHVALLLCFALAPAQACEVPGDGTSLRRALLRVKYLPETEVWELAQRKHANVQYVLSLDAPREHDGRCYWPVEARSGDTPWNVFYVTARGEEILVAAPGASLLPLEEWRAQQR